MPSPDDSELRLVKDQGIRPRLLEDAAKEPLPARTEPPRPSRFVYPFLFVATAALAGLFAASAQRFFQREALAPRPPLSILKPIRQALPTPPAPPLVVLPESLHVTSVVLGNPRLAVVNGRQLAEGDWLELRSDKDVAALRVIKIEDGVVQFGYGGKVIEARLARK